MGLPEYEKVDASTTRVKRTFEKTKVGLIDNGSTFTEMRVIPNTGIQKRLTALQNARQNPNNTPQRNAVLDEHIARIQAVLT